MEITKTIQTKHSKKELIDTAKRLLKIIDVPVMKNKVWGTNWNDGIHFEMVKSLDQIGSIDMKLCLALDPWNICYSIDVMEAKVNSNTFLSALIGEDTFHMTELIDSNFPLELIHEDLPEMKRISDEFISAVSEASRSGSDIDDDEWSVFCDILDKEIHKVLTIIESKR